MTLGYVINFSLTLSSICSFFVESLNRILKDEVVVEVFFVHTSKSNRFSDRFSFARTATSRLVTVNIFELVIIGRLAPCQNNKVATWQLADEKISPDQQAR